MQMYDMKMNKNATPEQIDAAYKAWIVAHRGNLRTGRTGCRSRRGIRVDDNARRELRSGRIAKAQGLRGEVLVRSLSDAPNRWAIGGYFSRSISTSEPPPTAMHPLP